MQLGIIPSKFQIQLYLFESNLVSNHQIITSSNYHIIKFSNHFSAIPNAKFCIFAGNLQTVIPENESGAEERKRKHAKHNRKSGR
jgi:hypothetical protein